MRTVDTRNMAGNTVEGQDVDQENKLTPINRDLVRVQEVGTKNMAGNTTDEHGGDQEDELS